jgi:two-component system KDP operon response regulator KdpE
VTRILVVDDEPQLLRGLRVNLEARGYNVDVAADGATALDAATARRPEIVILDLGLPDMDGIDVIHGLRAWGSMPIVVLSAREQEPDKVAALDAGADDYVTKPFGMGELLARIRAAERRTASAAELAIVSTPDFRVDHLTPTEWHLVEILVRNPGKLVGQRQLLQEVWGQRYEEETNYLRVYMAQIRRKLEPDPAHPRYFFTEPGMGYRFESGAVRPTTALRSRNSSREEGSA